MRLQVLSRPGAGARTVLLALAGLLAALVLPARSVRADDVADGDRAFQAGHLDDALRWYEAAARSGWAEGQAGIGRVHLARGRLEEAIRAFRRAHEMDHELAPAWYGEGEALRQKGSCKEAVPLLEKAARLDRRFPEAQLALGRCLIETGQPADAIRELSKGLGWGREWAPRFYAARGMAWAAGDSLRRAAGDFTRARELAPQDASIRRAIGEFYMSRGTWALAIPELEAAATLDTSDVESQYQMARALFYDRRYDRALDVYQRLIAHHPDYAAARLGIGDLLYRAGEADPRRYAEARTHLAAYVRLAPQDSSGWSLLGRTLYKMGLADSALAALTEAERLGDRNPELYTAIGMIRSDRKEWDQARAALEKGEQSPHARAILAQIYEITGAREQADSLYRLAVARDSTSKEAAFPLRQMAKLRYRGKSFAAAESLFARAAALDSTDGEAWFYRGLCLKQLGRERDALDALRRAAVIDTTRADRFFWLGVVSDAQKETEEAERAFRRVVEIDSTADLAAKSYRQLGYYALMRKDWAEAIPSLEHAVALDPDDAMGWLWLAQGHHNAGHRQNAEKAYRRVLALDPGSVSAKRGLEVLGTGAGGRTTKEAGSAVATDGN
jgi:tetratricopeptide (TPR) repeat protein